MPTRSRASIGFSVTATRCSSSDRRASCIRARTAFGADRMKSSVSTALLGAVVLAWTSLASAAPEIHTIDPVHSSVGFNIRHFVSKVPGKFNKFNGTITVDRANPANNAVEATIDMASIDTDNQKRDDHLRSADFLDVAKHPTMAFKSTSWTKTGEDTFDVTGNLTLKNVTRPVTLKVALLGVGPGPGGAVLSGWEATTKINK